MSIELGNIVQGHKVTNAPGTSTLFFLYHDVIKIIPTDRKITYGHIVVDYRLHKPDPNRVRFTVEEELIEYLHEITTQTPDLVTTKILWNSIGSTPNAKCVCVDLESFYLKSPMARFEFMQIPAKLIPQSFIDEYELHGIEKECRDYHQMVS